MTSTRTMKLFIIIIGCIVPLLALEANCSTSSSVSRRIEQLRKQIDNTCQTIQRYHGPNAIVLEDSGRENLLENALIDLRGDFGELAKLLAGRNVEQIGELMFHEVGQMEDKFDCDNNEDSPLCKLLDQVV